MIQMYPVKTEGRFTTVDNDESTPEGYYHHAPLMNLAPATTYYLVMASDGEVSREFHFVTAPDDGRPVKFLFGGDRQGESQRRHWVPLFEKFQVDLLCEADHQTLKRTVPIYEDQEDPERGIVYIGDGGLGVPQRTPDDERWYLAESGLAMSAHHVHLLALDEEEIRGTAYGIDGEVLDRFTVEPRQILTNR